MALLQILLDRSFVLLGLLRCGGERVEFFEHFECVLFQIQPRGFRIVDPKPARLYLEKHALEMLKKVDAPASAAQQTQQDERPIEKDLKQSHVVSARRRQVSS